MEENKMGTVPVSRLVISMGLPLMLSLLISSLYFTTLWILCSSHGSPRMP